LLNFLKVYNKEKKNFTFIDLRDAQYHMALYEEIAEHSFKHVAVLKKRQILSSYFHVAKLINRFWFEEGSINKLAASVGTFIKDDWRFLEEYRNFLNTHTAWYRPCTPDKSLDWEQKVEISQGGRKRDIGLKSVMKGLILDKDPSAGCGGPVSLFFFDEAGIAPKMNQTLEFLLPALKSGMTYTGMFMTAGSVGELKECDPLKELILRPDSKDVLAVHTDLLDQNGKSGMCGLFIPEQWSMQPYIDEHGNSDVAGALLAILEERVRWKQSSLSPEDYRLRVSQKPTNIEEAFAYRDESEFPLHLVQQQKERIQNNNYFLENVDIVRNLDGSLTIVHSNKLPITDFPISPSLINKEGIIVMHERPVDKPKFGMYYASIDPVNEGKTQTSNSLCSIYIYKNQIEVTNIKEDGSVENILEPDKLVAWWCGRFDNIAKTHARLESMLEIYNAWALIENNVPGFIQYMILKNKQRYLVPKNQMLFLKELSANTNVYQEYGWKNVGLIFDNLKNYGIDFLKEELDTVTKSDGTIVKTTYGIERIPDIMLLKEMEAYRKGLNVDRLIAYSALAAFVTVQRANRGLTKITKYQDAKNLENSNKMSILKNNPFTNMGKNSSKRQAFKNLR
jgi:hypothetical protein